MTTSWPTAEAEIVIGIDDQYNFMNYADPSNPTILALQLDEPTTVIVSLDQSLIDAGWVFQDIPFRVRPDYSINFSSYCWIQNIIDGQEAVRSKFKLVFECARLGEYEYSLMFVDSHGQKIGLDPKIENGAGH